MREGRLIVMVQGGGTDKGAEVTFSQPSFIGIINYVKKTKGKHTNHSLTKQILKSDLGRMVSIINIFLLSFKRDDLSFSDSQKYLYRVVGDIIPIQ